MCAEIERHAGEYDKVPIVFPAFFFELRAKVLFVLDLLADDVGLGVVEVVRILHRLNRQQLTFFMIY